MKLAIDTNIFIYHFEQHPKFGASAKRLLQTVESGRHKAVVSVVTYAELLTLPARSHDDDLVKKYRELLGQFPNLSVIPVDIEIGHEAAELRGKHSSLRLMDAFILATAIRNKAEALITEDTRLMITELPVKVLSLEKLHA